MGWHNVLPQVKPLASFHAAQTQNMRRALLADSTAPSLLHTYKTQDRGTHCCFDVAGLARTAASFRPCVDGPRLPLDPGWRRTRPSAATDAAWLDGAAGSSVPSTKPTCTGNEHMLKNWKILVWISDRFRGQG